MALNIKNVEVERLVDEVTRVTGENKTVAVQRALEERRMRLVYQIDSDPRLAAHQGGSIRAIAFAGLPETCERVERLFPGRFCLFRGDETPREALERLGVPSTLVPASLAEESAYAESLLRFGKTLLASERHQRIRPFPPPSYVDAGTPRDQLKKRLAYAGRKGQLPLMRAHVGFRAQRS